jgi:UDP-N-acetylglucosamine 2-epimerase
MAYAAMARVANPFGDGRAAVRIADILEAHARFRDGGALSASG